MHGIPDGVGLQDPYMDSRHGLRGRRQRFAALAHPRLPAPPAITAVPTSEESTT